MEETKKAGGDGDVFLRRIEFHPVRKPFLGFINNPDFHLETLNPTTHRSTLPLLNPDANAAASAEHSLDPELCFGITVVGRIGAGLENLGNTCFLNSVLQCLTYTEPFAAYLQSGNHKSSCHTAGFCAMCALQNHVKRALQSTGRILAPKDLVMNLRCISRNFRNARQEDAHEYMVNLLESMHKCCLPSGVPSESPSAYEKSLVHKIFGGRLRSQVKCMQCSYCSNTFDPFLDLSLEIMKADSLWKALSHFTAVEQLDGGERQYQCQRCKQKVKALKQLTVHQAPYVLSIHLKRFGSHLPGQKIDKKIEFGPTLDLKPFVSGFHEGDLKYTLYGVLVHAGWSTHSGHYYCFVQTSSGMWHSLDDNRVVQVSERTVLQQKAYMLFYVRDRKNLAPRKAIDQKENGVPSIIGNRGHCASEAVQNGSIAAGLRTLDLSKKPQLKESSIVKISTGLVMAEETPLKVSMSQSSSMALVMGFAAKQSINGPSVEEVRQKSVPSSIEGSNFNPCPTVATSGTKTDRESLCQGSNPLAAPLTCSRSQSSGPEKHAVNEVTHVSDIIANKEMLSRESQKKVNDLNYEKSISARLSNQSGLENNQNEGGRVSSELSCQKAEYNGLTSMETKLEEQSTKFCKRNGYVQKEARGHHHNLQKVLMPKRKVIKSRIASLHLGPRFLMKASLSLYKKKKHKRNKWQSLELKSHIQENFGEESSSGGLEPSTSEKMRITDLVSTHSKRRRRKSSAEKGSGQRATKDVQTFKEESVINVTEGNSSDRIFQNNSVIVSNEPPLKCSSATSEGKQWGLREPDAAQVKRGLFENGLTSMLTRGLEEFTVACWDEIESSPSQHLGSMDGKSINIGYVPDEWDKEYDRGKRKKVRTPKDSFGNSNPFQEIATKKAKLKKTKGDRTVFGNQPLRIR